MIINMSYRQYKQHYSDCATIQGTYNAGTKTIDVDVPEGRQKKSGVRGQRFYTYHFIAIYQGKRIRLGYRAVCKENALKQHRKECAAGNYIYTEEETTF